MTPPHHCLRQSFLRNCVIFVVVACTKTQTTVQVIRNWRATLSLQNIHKNQQLIFRLSSNSFLIDFALYVFKGGTCYMHFKVSFKYPSLHVLILIDAGGFGTIQESISTYAQSKKCWALSLPILWQPIIWNIAINSETWWFQLSMYLGFSILSVLTEG